MKVIILGDFPHSKELIRGGVQASVFGLSKALQVSDKVSSSTFISLPSKSLPFDKKDDIDGVKIRYFRAPFNSLAFGILKVFNFWNYAFGDSETIHHVHSTSPVGTFLIVAYTLLRKKFVWSVHGIVEKELKNELEKRFNLKNFLYFVFYAFIERLCLRLSKVILVDTPYVYSSIKPHTKADIHVIPQGIFPSEFQFFGTASEKNRKAVISVGVISRRKGHHLLLKAFEAAYKVDNELRLLILGSVTDSEYFIELKKLISELNLVEVVSLIENASRRTIVDALRMSSIFALHSEEESQGIAICEALASGLPVVATSVGGIPDIVIDGYSGFLYSYDDIDGFSKGIIKLAQDDISYEYMAKNSLEEALKYDWHSISERVISVYCDILLD